MDWHALFSLVLPAVLALLCDHGPSSSAHRHTRKQIHARTDFYRQIQASHEQKNRTIRVDDRKRRENAQDLFIYLADKSRLMEYLKRSRMKKGAGRVTDTCGMMEGWWNSPAEPEKDTPTCLLAFRLFVWLRDENRWRMLIGKEIAAIRSNVAQSVASFRALAAVCLSRRSGRTAVCWGGKWCRKTRNEARRADWSQHHRPWRGKLTDGTRIALDESGVEDASRTPGRCCRCDAVLVRWLQVRPALALTWREGEQKGRGEWRPIWRWVH